MAQPEGLRYSNTHEWVAISGEEATIGITDYAQEQLGDVVFVEFPAVGKELASGETMGTIESVKAVSDLIAPLACTVSEGNAELESRPELVNQDPYGAGWLVKVRVAPGAGEDLMDTAAYERFVAEEGGH